MDKVESGQIKIDADAFPAFMYDLTRKPAYKLDDIQYGFCRGYILLRVSVLLSCLYLSLLDD